ncbi:ABZJ_00895 family protein [Acinetobacter bereziniae]|uniref:ABZJ_00895 family protein n=1 Tax=Acinetobacter bereziniae TaxID=106648 RepID=UPI00124F8485|nr:ABZJ_00895 family protein [Acinetobacter bereziniae]
MVSLNKYFLWFFLLCLVLTMIAGILAAILPNEIAGVFTALPYLLAMIIVLYRFLKQQHRAPTDQERRSLTLGFTLIFWSYNILGVFVGVWFFSRNDPEIWQSFIAYMQNIRFLSTILIMLLLLAVPLFLITYWFYGTQAKRMAAKMFENEN